jgi:hypothetical protein
LKVSKSQAKGDEGSRDTTAREEEEKFGVMKKGSESWLVIDSLTLQHKEKDKKY